MIDVLRVPEDSGPAPPAQDDGVGFDLGKHRLDPSSRGRIVAGIGQPCSPTEIRGGGHEQQASEDDSQEQAAQPCREACSPRRLDRAVDRRVVSEMGGRGGITGSDPRRPSG